MKNIADINLSAPPPTGTSMYGSLAGTVLEQFNVVQSGTMPITVFFSEQCGTSGHVVLDSFTVLITTY